MRAPDNSLGAEIPQKTALILVAVAINALEYLFPRIPVLPWLKPGIANAVTIIWIIRYGSLDAVLFTALRTWITSFYFGFSLVSLVLSLSGGLLATAGMGVLWLLLGKRKLLGLVGLGIAGAVMHNTGQLCGVYLFVASSAAVWYQIPFMLVASLIFGAITGLLSFSLVPLFYHGTVIGINENNGFSEARILHRKSRLIAGMALLSASIALVFLKSPGALGIAAACAALLALVAARGRPGVLFYPITSFWMLFLFVAIMYGFFSYGQSVSGLSFVTHEGIRETGLQWLRLFAWIELSTVLTRLSFNRIVLVSALRHSPLGRDTIAAALFALELLPGLFALVSRSTRLDLRRLIRQPKDTVVWAIKTLYSDVVALVKAP